MMESTCGPCDCDDCKPRGIYVAAKSEMKIEAAACARFLSSHGWRVVSTWHDDPKFDFTDELFRSPGAILAATEATRGALQIIGCHALVQLLPRADDPNRFNSTGGNHVEFGMALGLGKRVIVHGPPLNVFHHLPGVVCVIDPWGILEALS